MRFSENVASLEPSATLALAARARALREEGREIVDLSAGEPSWGTPDFAADAGVEAIRAGKLGYPPTAGVPELRRAIADYLDQTTGRRVEPDRVLVSAGVKQALFNCVFTLFGPGDEVLVPVPAWTSYLPQVELAGARPVPVPTRWEEGFLPRVDALEEARTARSLGLMLNSPSNPTGAVLDLERLGRIAEWADAHGVWILADEIYRLLGYGDDPPPSLLDLPSLPERWVVLDGVSKSLAMTGWRIGFAAGPAGLIEKASDLQSQTTSGAAAPSQYAAAAALGRQEDRDRAVEENLARLRVRRETIVEGTRGLPGLDVRAPDGGIFLFARLSDGRASSKVAEELLVDAGVACIPGDAFHGPGYLRFNFAVEEATLEEGVRRLRNYFRGD